MLRTLCTTRSNFHGKFGICSVKTYPTPGQHPYDLLLPIDFFSGCFQQLLLLPVGDLIFLVIASVRGNFFFLAFSFRRILCVAKKTREDSYDDASCENILRCFPQTVTGPARNTAYRNETCLCYLSTTPGGGVAQLIAGTYIYLCTCSSSRMQSSDQVSFLNVIDAILFVSAALVSLPTDYGFGIYRELEC